MLLTIGMAHMNDWDGAAFTIQNLKFQLIHYRLQDQTEIIVIDDSPIDSEHAKFLMGLCQWGGVKVRFIKAKISGTAQTRNQIFDEAQGKYVLVLDCHVLLCPNFIFTLLDYYHQDLHGEVDDLIHGQIMMDDLVKSASMMDPVWRGEMFGIWSEAWTLDDVQFCIRPNLTAFTMGLHDILTSEPVFVDDDRFKGVAYNGHENFLTQIGAVRMAHLDQPFEIPAHGLGMFSSRKDSWLRFHEHFRGFGGEEIYIHERYRRAGRKSICIPQLKFWHRFGRIGGAPYNPTRRDKVRNSVLGYLEFGWSLDPIHEHFVQSNLISQQDWDAILKDPVNVVFPKAVIRSSVANLDQQLKTVDELYDKLKSVNRDLNQHFEIIKEYAAKCNSILEISERRESTVALAAGKPLVIHSYQKEMEFASLLPMLAAKNNTEIHFHNFDFNLVDIGPVQLENHISIEMVFLDAWHNSDMTRKVLNWIRIKETVRYCMIHDTVSHGSQGPVGNEPGIQFAVNPWLAENSDWFVCYHSDVQYGLTILSNDQSLKPTHVIQPWPPGYGPGTELKQLFYDMGIRTTPTCKCNSVASKMDRLGAEWCEENFNTVADWVMDSWADLYQKSQQNPDKSILPKWVKFTRSIGGDRLMKYGAEKLLKKAIRISKASQ